MYTYIIDKLHVEGVLFISCKWHMLVSIRKKTIILIFKKSLSTFIDTVISYSFYSEFTVNECSCRK